LIHTASYLGVTTVYIESLATIETGGCRASPKANRRWRGDEAMGRAGGARKR